MNKGGVPFYVSGEHPWQELGGGVRRKVMSWNDDLMAVAVQFDKGAVGTPHAHDVHVQIGYIAAGAFEVSSGDVKKTLKAGDSYLAEKNVMHGAVALEDKSVILDIFTPKRGDFLPAE